MSKEKYIEKIKKGIVSELVIIKPPSETIRLMDGKRFIFTDPIKDILVGNLSISTFYDARMITCDYWLGSYISKKYVLSLTDSLLVAEHLSKEVQKIIEDDKKKRGKQLNDYLLHIVDVVFEKGYTDPLIISQYVNKEYGVNTDISQGGEMWFIIQMLRKKYDEDYNPVI